MTEPNSNVSIVTIVITRDYKPFLLRLHSEPTNRLSVCRAVIDSPKFTPNG